ncbi:MAG TPA: hypothetical protein PLY09_01830 [Methanothrix sp.]|nr:hypothetical protein [Methanothrix sp.]HPJ83483.1 hypothetical protein [Methanothrix sp.]
MSSSTDKQWFPPVLFLGEVALQLYYATVRSTHFVRKSTFRYIRKNDITIDRGILDCFRNGLDFDQIPHDKQDEYCLTVQLGGEITSVDEVVFHGCRIANEEVRIWLTITKVESQDVEPFPVEAFVLIPLNKTIISRQMTIIEFKGYYRSFEGELSPLEEAPIEAVSVLYS